MYTCNVPVSCTTISHGIQGTAGGQGSGQATRPVTIAAVLAWCISRYVRVALVARQRNYARTLGRRVGRFEGLAAGDAGRRLALVERGVTACVGGESIILARELRGV
jgi:hypothetical protein